MSNEWAMPENPSDLAREVHEYLLNLHDGYAYGEIEDDEDWNPGTPAVTIRYNNRTSFGTFFGSMHEQVAEIEDCPVSLSVADVGHADMVLKIDGFRRLG